MNINTFNSLRFFSDQLQSFNFYSLIKSKSLFCLCLKLFHHIFILIAEKINEVSSLNDFRTFKR